MTLRGGIQSRADKYAEGHYKKPTKAEHILYSILTKNRINFEQQKVISNRYIADFYLPEWNLYIEVDGKHHRMNKHQIKKDRTRYRYIMFGGYYLLRIRNEMLENNQDQIMRVIREAILRIASKQAHTPFKPKYLKKSSTGWIVKTHQLRKFARNKHKPAIDYLYNQGIYYHGRNHEGGLTALLNHYTRA